MPASTIDQQIRAQIDAFIDQITTLVRAQAMEAVGQALGGEVPVPTRTSAGGRKKATRRKGPARKASGKRVRRSSADLEAIGEKVLAHVRANPGCSMTDVGEALGSSAIELRPAVQLLLESKALRTTGQRRGTKYFVGGRGAATKEAKAARKKATRKPTARKKATRTASKKARQKPGRRKKATTRAAPKATAEPQAA